MRHLKRTAKLGRQFEHRNAMLANMVCSLIKHRRVTTTRGTISSSLFLAGQDAGLSDAMILRLADIFGWDIDFVLDIRAGDTFTVIFEEYFRDG